MALKWKRIFLFTAFIIVTVLAVVLYVNFFAGSSSHEYDGTLVKLDHTANLCRI